MSNWLKECLKENNNDPRCTAITIGRTVSAVLSCTGCLFALFMIVIYKKFRFFTQRMVAYLLVPCFFIACFSFSTSLEQDVGCSVKGFFRNYAGLTQNLWIICIDVHLLILTVRKSKCVHLEKVYHALVWGGGLLISLIPWIGNHYGNAGIWCWIKGESHYENGLRIICYYFWLMLLVFGGGGIYIFIIWKTMSRIHTYEGTYDPEREATKERYKKSIRPLLFYPIVDLLLASVATANRIQNWANPGNPVFGLYLMHSIVSPLWGFVNAMLYLMNKDTLKQLHPKTFATAVRTWGKTTFTFTKSDVVTDKKFNDYTLKDENVQEPDTVDNSASVMD